MGLPDHLTCLLRNLYAGQEAKIRTGHGTIDWFQIRKGVRQGCILSAYLFNFYAEYIMRNAGLDEAQAGIKIAGRNTSNLRLSAINTDVTTLMVESEDQIGKGVHQGCILSPCLFNFYAKYITVIQVYAPASNAEVADVEWFYEDLQDLLELTPQKDVLFLIGDW